MADDQLTTLVTQGFAGINERLRERDKEVSGLSEKVIRMEGVLEGLKSTVGRVEGDINNAKIAELNNRVYNLETANTEIKDKHKENSKLLKGLVISVILLLLGFLLNFVRISVI